MHKDFDQWSITKKAIDQKSAVLFCHEREIWWCSLGVNVGFEQDGTGKNFDRPILVFRGFNERVFLGVALTGKKKQGKFYFYLGRVENRDASAVLSQIRLIDSKRLVRKMSTLDENTFKRFEDALRTLLFS